MTLRYVDRPAEYDLFIKRGQYFSRSLTFTNAIDLTGSNFQGQIRVDNNALTSNTAIPFTTAIDIPNKTVTFSLSASQTGAMAKTRYFYDFWWVDSALHPLAILEGKVIVNESTTVIA